MRKRFVIQILLFALWAFPLQNSLAQQVPKNAHLSTSLTGQLTGIERGDTITLTKYNSEIDDPRMNVTMSAVAEKERFDFNLNKIEKSLTISLNFPRARLASHPELLVLSRCLLKIATGEHLFIAKQGNSIIFRGKFARENECFYKLADFDQKYWANKLQQSFSDTTLIKDFAAIDQGVIARLKYLDRYRGKISEAVFAKIVANTKYAATGKKYFWLNRKKLIQAVYNPNPIFISGEYSEELASYVFEKFKYDSCTVSSKRFEIGKCYNYLTAQYSGELRERLLTKLLVKNIKSDSLMKYANFAIRDFQNPGLRTTIIKIVSGLAVGTTAYNFRLPAQDEKSYGLVDFKGKVVVLDFWFTGCGACQILAPKLAEIENKFDRNTVVFVSVSADKYKSVWQKSLLGGHYTSSTSVKLYTDGQGFDHPLLKHFNIKAFPTLIIIDKYGKMMRSPVDPRFDEGKDMIELLKSAL